jgi:hypothetical protein
LARPRGGRALRHFQASAVRNHARSPGTCRGAPKAPICGLVLCDPPYGNRKPEPGNQEVTERLKCNAQLARSAESTCPVRG